MHLLWYTISQYLFHSSREGKGDQNEQRRRQNEAIGISIFYFT